MSPEALHAIHAVSRPDLLQNGSNAQRAAARAVSELAVFQTLAAHAPVIAGSYPLDLQTDASDIDVLATARDLPAFLEMAGRAFGAQTGFRSRLAEIHSIESVVINFNYGCFPFEIFAQRRPVLEQDGFLHLVAEYRLLALADARFFETVRAFRFTGQKTEPAFCAALGVSEDPYAYLRKLAVQSDEVLLRALKRRTSNGPGCD